MLAHSHNESSLGNGNWTVTGLGSEYRFQPYSNTLYRGYGWGRIIDDECFSEPVVWDFRSSAAQTTRPAQKQT
jgi:hypothetical protein